METLISLDIEERTVFTIQGKANEYHRLDHDMIKHCGEPFDKIIIKIGDKRYTIMGCSFCGAIFLKEKQEE